MAQGPADDDDENESHKAWTMEMLTNDGDILTSMMNEEELMSNQHWWHKAQRMMMTKMSCTKHGQWRC